MSFFPFIVCFLLFYKNLSLNSGQHPERIKRFSNINLRQITFRLTNVIPERIIFVSRGITVILIVSTNYIFLHVLDNKVFYDWSRFCHEHGVGSQISFPWHRESEKWILYRIVSFYKIKKVRLRNLNLRKLRKFFNNTSSREWICVCKANRCATLGLDRDATLRKYGRKL